MPRLNRIYTRTGDDGSTRLGNGRKVGKDSPRIEAYGTVDELNSVLGVAVALGLEADVETEVCRIQNELFRLGSDLCVPQDEGVPVVPRMEATDTEVLEKLIDRLTAELGPLENFILPGGSRGGAALHLARTVCRRAERLLVTLSGMEAVNPDAVRYLNRLSDALFVLARQENRLKGRPETVWDSRK